MDSTGLSGCGLRQRAGCFNRLPPRSLDLGLSLRLGRGRLVGITPATDGRIAAAIPTTGGCAFFFSTQRPAVNQLDLHRSALGKALLSSNNDLLVSVHAVLYLHKSGSTHAQLHLPFGGFAAADYP